MTTPDFKLPRRLGALLEQINNNPNTFITGLSLLFAVGLFLASCSVAPSDADTPRMFNDLGCVASDIKTLGAITNGAVLGAILRQLRS